MQFLVDYSVEQNKEFFLDEDESFHLIKVLRLKKGEKIKVFDGKRQFLCEIIDFFNKKAYLKAVEVIFERYKKFNINLYFPFIERKLFEDIIRAGTELGVDYFIPLKTEFTQKHFIFDLEEKKERLKAIIRSAVKQSERLSFPVITELKDIKNIFEKDKKFFVMSKEKIFNKLLNVDEIKSFVDNEINIVVGPEGGFSTKDFENARSENIFPLKISDNLLRVETAAISAVAIFSSLMVKK